MEKGKSAQKWLIQIYKIWGFWHKEGSCLWRDFTSRAQHILQEKKPNFNDTKIVYKFQWLLPKGAFFQDGRVSGLLAGALEFGNHSLLLFEISIDRKMYLEKHRGLLVSCFEFAILHSLNIFCYCRIDWWRIFLMLIHFCIHFEAIFAPEKHFKTCFCGICILFKTPFDRFSLLFNAFHTSKTCEMNDVFFSIVQRQKSRKVVKYVSRILMGILTFLFETVAKNTNWNVWWEVSIEIGQFYCARPVLDYCSWSQKFLTKNRKGKTTFDPFRYHVGNSVINLSSHKQFQIFCDITNLSKSIRGKIHLKKHLQKMQRLV